MSKIEQTIIEIEDYLDNCKFQPLSNGTKIIVNKEEIDELISELRLKTPDEIKKYKRIIANKDAILKDAKAKADAILQKANEQKEELISQHEIMTQAYEEADSIVAQAQAQAQEILDSANQDANTIRSGAMQYTDDVLANLQNIITHTMENVTIKYDNFMKSLNQSLDVVVANRSELYPSDDENVQENEDNGIDDDFADNLEIGFDEEILEENMDTE